MAKQSRGIEVFGRGATIVEPRSSATGTRLLGAIAVLLAIATTALLVLAIRANAMRDEAAPALAIAALVISVLAVLCGLTALLAGRGRLLGLLAVLLAAASNPWLLTRALEYLDALPSR